MNAVALDYVITVVAIVTVKALEPGEVKGVGF